MPTVRRFVTISMTDLNIAVAHMEVKPGQPEENLTELLELFNQAADEGAQIVVGPEMSLSGYSFECRDKIKELVQAADGPAGQALSELARKRGLYVVAAWAERDPVTDIYYNTAFVFGPTGDLLKKYRKVNAESRWACPGQSVQDNVFSTPWGTMGVLVCADSYHGLLPRVTVLKGAELLFVPSNWPASSFSPGRVWRMRAWENGCYFLAANRTGMDRTMDFSLGFSCCFAPDGQEIFSQKSEHSTLMWVRLPLTHEGRLAHLRREEMLNSRKPELYHRVVGNFSSIVDLTSFLDLPQPGLLDIHCLTQEDGMSPLLSLQKHVGLLNHGGFVVLPKYNYSDQELEQLQKTASENGQGLVAARTSDGRYFFKGPEDKNWLLPDRLNTRDGYPHIDYGSARIMLAPVKDLIHPELVLSAAKWGCDLAVSSELDLSEEQAALISMRPIEQMALAACATNGAAIGLIPQGHQPGRGVRAGAGDRCTYVLDTVETRVKHFQDRVDYDTLLRPSVSPER